MNINWKSHLGFTISLVMAYLIIRYWAVAEGIVTIALAAAYPLFLGGAIAYILNILMSFYERILPRTKPVDGKGRRPAALLLAVISLCLVIMFLFRMILPELLNCLQLILEKLPGAVRSGYLWLDENFSISAYLTDKSLLNTLENLNVQETLKKVIDGLMTGLGGAMGSIVSGVATVFSGLATAFIAVAFAVYILFGKERLGGQINRFVKVYLGDNALARFDYVCLTVDSCFHSFIVGQCVEAVILGSLCALGMTIFRFPYAMMIGCLVGFTALIPIAGAYIGAAVGAFMIFTVNPLQALLFVIFLVVLQQLEGNLIYPRVVGASIGLPGIFVLAAITIGGGVMGIPGMLLGVPLTASVYQLVKANLQAREATIVEMGENQS